MQPGMTGTGKTLTLSSRLNCGRSLLNCLLSSLRKGSQVGGKVSANPDFTGTYRICNDIGET